MPSIPVLVRHDPGCPIANRTPFGGHSDAARRASDTYELHRAASLEGSLGGWFAVALADGATDGVLYDSKLDAVLHQHHNERFYAFVCISPGAMSVCAAESFLRYTRALADHGAHLPDPGHRHGGREVIRRLTREDMVSLVNSILSGGRRPASGLIYPRR